MVNASFVKGLFNVLQRGKVSSRDQDGTAYKHTVGVKIVNKTPRPLSFPVKYTTYFRRLVFQM